MSSNNQIVETYIGTGTGTQVDAALAKIASLEETLSGTTGTIPSSAAVKNYVDESTLSGNVVYDISEANNGTTYANLAAALNNGNNIPASIRKGGISIKFIQSSDNKYVQYRLMSTAWSNVVANWQGVDDEPVYNSKDLITGSGVLNASMPMQNTVVSILGRKDEVELNLKCCQVRNYSISVANKRWSPGNHYFYPISVGDKVEMKGAAEKNSHFCFLSSDVLSSGLAPVVGSRLYQASDGAVVSAIAPEGAKYLYITKNIEADNRTPQYIKFLSNIKVEESSPALDSKKLITSGAVYNALKAITKSKIGIVFMYTGDNVGISFALSNTERKCVISANSGILIDRAFLKISPYNVPIEVDLTGKSCASIVLNYPNNSEYFTEQDITVIEHNVDTPASKTLLGENQVLLATVSGSRVSCPSAHRINNEGVKYYNNTFAVIVNTNTFGSTPLLFNFDASTLTIRSNSKVYSGLGVFSLSDATSVTKELNEDKGLVVFKKPQSGTPAAVSDIRVVGSSEFALSNDDFVLAYYDKSRKQVVSYSPYTISNAAYDTNLVASAIGLQQKTTVGVTCNVLADKTILLNGTSNNHASIELVTDVSGNPSATPYFTFEEGKTYKCILKELSGTGGSLYGFVKAIGGSSNLISAEKNSLRTLTPTTNYGVGRIAINIPEANISYVNAKYAFYITEEENYLGGYAGVSEGSLKPGTVNTAAITNGAVTMNKLSEELQDIIEAISPKDIYSTIKNNTPLVLPEYFHTEAQNVLTNIRQNEDPDFTMIVFSDPHMFTANKYKKYYDLYKIGGVNCVVGMGDYQIYDDNASKINTINNLHKLFVYAGYHKDLLLTIGNHDTAFVHANEGKLTTTQVLSKKQNHRLFASHLNGVVSFNENDPYGCYYFKDYDAEKVRVIILNTSDIYDDNDELVWKFQASLHLHQRQMTWFANTALDFSSKGADKNNWSVIVCCHYDVTTAISKIMRAAKEGVLINETFNIRNYLTYNSSTDSYNTPVDTSKSTQITINKDYSTQGAINVIALLCGHTHVERSEYKETIPRFEFFCDNNVLNDIYSTEVSGLTAGKYYIDRGSNGKQAFTLSNNQPNITKVIFNNYHKVYCEITLVRSDGNPILSTAYPSTYDETAVELTGFEPMRTPGTVSTESCSVITVDKSERKIKIHPYGEGNYRELTY